MPSVLHNANDLPLHRSPAAPNWIARQIEIASPSAALAVQSRVRNKIAAKGIPFFDPAIRI